MGDNALATLLQEVQLELDVYRPARESFYDFIAATKPDMLMNWFHRRLADALQQFLEDVAGGLQPRLLLTAPPRHSKSEVVSRRFPAWVFGKNPKLNIIACSYADSLAQAMNRDVQRIMDSELYAKIFPDTKLNSENIATVSGKPLRNSNVFEIVDHLGSYRCKGVGGGIVGTGFDIGIIDDPISGAEEANSEAQKLKIWEWYQSVFYNRQSPCAGILLIMTRWAVDDLAGKLLEQQQEGGDKWTVIRFPAIAEEDEEFRKVGDALQPERYPIERLRAIEVTSGSHAWASLYQARPGPKGGTIFKRSGWKFWTILPELEEVILSVDCTFKELKDNDYVALQIWGRSGANKYLMKRTRERMGFAATVLAVRSHHALIGPGLGTKKRCTAILVEDKANGPAVIETLRSSLPGVVPIEPEGGKIARAFAMQAEQEAGNIFLPDPTVDHDIETFLGEVSNFPTVPHDDETDAMTQAINWFRNRQGAYGMLEFAKSQVQAMRDQKKVA